MSDRSTARVEVDAAAFAAVEHWPARCAPHGSPPVERVRTLLVSRPRRRKWYVIGGAGLLDVIAAAGETVSELRRVWVENWPVCQKCQRRRQRLRVLTRVMAWGGGALLLVGCVAGIGIRVATEDSAPMWLMAPILVGLASLLGSTIPLTYAQPSRIARTWVVEDGAKVELVDPDPDFARDLRRLAAEPADPAEQDG